MLRGKKWGWAVVSWILLAACGPSGGGSGGSGGSGGGGGAGGGDAGDPQRLWERQAVQPTSAGSPSLFVSAAGTVDIVYVGQLDFKNGIVWQMPGSAPELIAEEQGFDISMPRVARDAGDVVHVVWGANNEVKYATRKGGAWTVESVATDRFRPDLALASDGTPHLAFVDDITGNASAYHATRGAGGWQIETVTTTQSFNDVEIGLVLTSNDTPIVAAPDLAKKGIWVAEGKAGGGWTIVQLAADQNTSGRIDLDIGPAGVVAAFKSETHAMAAFRATGSATWSVESVAHHDSYDARIAAAVGAKTPWVISDVDVDYPNGSAFLERTPTGWAGQLLAARNVDCAASAIARDAAGEPLVAFSCSGSLYLMRPIGYYPADWKSRCEQASAEFCQEACQCGVDNEQCCWGLGGSSTCTSSFGCPANAPATLCGDPTISPEQLQACRDELSTLTCSANSPLDLTGACAKLYKPLP